LATVLRDAPKPRLRVFRLLAAVATYCARNAGRLIILVWFPCVASLACQVAIEWLSFGDHPLRLPDWLSGNLNPRPWLTAVVTALWGAMVWAFVLSDLAERNSRRGLVTARLLRRGRLRFELSRDVVLAAAIFAAANVLDIIAQILLAAPFAASQLSDSASILLGLAETIRVVVMAAVFVWMYLVAGHVLRTGRLDGTHVWRITRGNRLRVLAVFLLLSLATVALSLLAVPAVNWLESSFGHGTLRGVLIRYLADFPFFMLWTVVYAVTVGIVLGALDGRPPNQAPARPVRHEPHNRRSATSSIR
jgi:hypothetical protein